MNQTMKQLYADLEIQIETLGHLLSLEQRIGSVAEEADEVRMTIERILRQIRSTKDAA